MAVNMSTMLAGVILLLLAYPCNFNRIPPHDEVARMARFVTNQVDWASLATISTHDPIKGQPFSNVFSISDGPVGSGSGVPYMYLSPLEISMEDIKVNKNASLSVSLAQTDYCKKQGYDPESPLCAHVIFAGTVVEVKNTSKEGEYAKKALFSRHPEMASWPVDHDFFFAKMDITIVWVLDFFGGIKTVTPEEYYKATPFKMHP